jgi:hypothetical protein
MMVVGPGERVLRVAHVLIAAVELRSSGPRDAYARSMISGQLWSLVTGAVLSLAASV